jgi:hypothetical protein
VCDGTQRRSFCRSFAFSAFRATAPALAVWRRRKHLFVVEQIRGVTRSLAEGLLERSRSALHRALRARGRALRLQHPAPRRRPAVAYQRHAGQRRGSVDPSSRPTASPPTAARSGQPCAHAFHDQLALELRKCVRESSSRSSRTSRSSQSNPLHTRSREVDARSRSDCEARAQLTQYIL